MLIKIYPSRIKKNTAGGGNKDLLIGKVMKKHLLRSQCFLRDSRGNIALMTAVLGPILLFLVGAGLDFSRWNAQRAGLKEVADLLATRGAREFLLANAGEANIKSIVDSAIKNDVAAPYNLSPFVHETRVNIGQAEVTVTLTQSAMTGLILTKIFPYNQPIEVTSTAVAKGGSNICVIALETAQNDAVRAETSATLTAPECAIVSNSTAARGVSVSGSAKLNAEMICSSGGYEGGWRHYDPLPITDCPPYEDPLSQRTPPAFGGCDHYDKVIGDTTPIHSVELNNIIAETIAGLDGANPGTLPGYTRYDLFPGVYCGGLYISDQDADVHLAPGVYVIKDGDLHVDKGARVFGHGVGFYLEGTSPTFNFDKTSIVHLKAPETGPLAGLLFWEADSVGAGETYMIESANARELLGTIYLKKGTLLIDSALPIADSSAYTAIVARKVQMSGSPDLFLNADYQLTNVPVPNGVGPIGGSTYLRE